LDTKRAGGVSMSEGIEGRRPVLEDFLVDIPPKGREEKKSYVDEIKQKLAEERIDEIIVSLKCTPMEKAMFRTALKAIIESKMSEDGDWVKLEVYLTGSIFKSVKSREKTFRYVLAKFLDAPFRLEWRGLHYLTIYVRKR